MTTVADVRQAYRDAQRHPYQISAAHLRDPYEVKQWLTRLAVLEARIRRYALEHGITAP